MKLKLTKNQGCIQDFKVEWVGFTLQTNLTARAIILLIKKMIHAVRGDIMSHTPLKVHLAHKIETSFKIIIIKNKYAMHNTK